MKLFISDRLVIIVKIKNEPIFQINRVLSRNREDRDFSILIHRFGTMTATVPGKVSRRNERVYAKFRWLWRSFAAKTWRAELSKSGRESRRQSVRRPVLMRLSFKTVRVLPSFKNGDSATFDAWHLARAIIFARRGWGRSTFRSPSALVKSWGRTPGGYFISRGICSPRMQRFSPELSVARRVQETEKLRLFFFLFFFQSVSRSLKVSWIFFYKFLGEFFSLFLL